jgi:hypothetical protein
VWNLPKLGMKKGGKYIAKDCAHLKNMKLYAQRGSKSILAEVNNLMGEGNPKMVPMKTLFHVSCLMFNYESLYELFASFRVPNNPTMFNYESLYELFASFRVPNNPTMHWSNFARWVFVEFMCTQVEDDTIKVIQYAQFIALSCDEVTTIGNGSWICIHAYVVDD